VFQNLIILSLYQHILFIDTVNYVTVDTSCFATFEAKNESKMKVAARQVKEMWT